ncbi:hypothetical protein J6590_051414 [Homalodisca vitripennis]|nr:hypothetical protein J6590_051414 [Homalodisca vitripennis]
MYSTRRTGQDDTTRARQQQYMAEMTGTNHAYPSSGRGVHSSLVRYTLVQSTVPFRTSAVLVLAQLKS